MKSAHLTPHMSTARKNRRPKPICVRQHTRRRDRLFQKQTASLPGLQASISDKRDRKEIQEGLV